MDNRDHSVVVREVRMGYAAIRTWIAGILGTGGFLGIVIPGQPLNFTGVTPIPTTTYTATYFYPLFNQSWNIPNMFPIGETALGNFFGQPLGNQLITAFIIVNMIGIIWARQDDAAIPLFLLWILGLVLFAVPGFLPPGWSNVIWGFELLTMGGIAYTLYRGRRNS
jgi:hypothetical protein